MTSRPGRKIARAQAHREKHARLTHAGLQERRRRSTIVMGVVGLLVTIGVVTALLVNRDNDDDPDGVTVETPEPQLTTTIASDASTTTIASDGSTTTADTATSTTTSPESDASTSTVAAPAEG